MDDSRSQRILGLKREIATLQTEERRLTFIVTSRYQTHDFKRRAENDLLHVRQRIAKFVEELKSVE